MVSNYLTLRLKPLGTKTVDGRDIDVNYKFLIVKDQIWNEPKPRALATIGAPIIEKYVKFTHIYLNITHIS